ncbi:MAG: DUF4870 domain-containing protein [Flavobacteriaceae bacterium]
MDINYKEESIAQHQKNVATFIHLSTFLRFAMPFGNFIDPIILWISNKDKSEFVDAHGKQAINFQISILLYTVIFWVLSIPVFVLISLNAINPHGFFDFYLSKNLPSSFISSGLITAVGLLLFKFVFEVAFIVLASLKARDGQPYKYPLTINFIK